MAAMIRRGIKALIERALGPYNYRLVNPDHTYGIDVIADINRLARAYGIDVELAFDVGANIGKMSLAFRQAWPQATIYAFEPSGPVAEGLRRNSALHPPFVVEQLALGDRDGGATFYVHEDAPDLNSLQERSPYAERFDRIGKAEPIEVATLDRFCAARDIARVNVLKIDTEGSDYDVLVGGAGLLSRRRIDFVYCEFNSLDSQAGSLVPIAALLAEHEFCFVASYNDYIATEGAFFSVSNALFVRPPPGRTPR